MHLNEKRPSSILLFLLLFGIAALACRSRSFGIGAHAFVPCPIRATPPARRLSQSSTIRSLSNDNNNNNNDNDGKKDDLGFLDFGLLARRLEKADTMEMRNDATLVACYVLCRFLVYDITAGAKLHPGWELQDWIWLTGTFSSATVLVIYYVVAGLLSRTYETNTTFAVFGPSPVLRALVNVALSCPVWLVTENLLGFGPSNIGGDSLGVAISTGFVGLGSFMALAKTLTAGMR